MSAITKLLDIALAEVGYLEKATNKNLVDKTANAGKNNYTKYANEIDTKYTTFYNGKKNGYAWCDVFVDWCMIKAFGVDLALKMIGQPKKSCGAGCGFSASYYKQIKSFYKEPKKGDQVFFLNSSKNICHTGLVYKVDTTYIYTVEGNTSSAEGVVSNGGAVAKKKYKRNSSSIYGYGRPLYNLYKEVKPVGKLDNTPDDYGVKPVEWAKSEGILEGDENGNLKLHDNLTRQDFVVMLYRYHHK